MSRINLGSRSLSRVELDQRSRDARLRLEQLERLLVSHARLRRYQRRRLLPFGAGRYTRALQERRVRGPLSDQRPSRMPAFSFSGSYSAAYFRCAMWHTGAIRGRFAGRAWYLQSTVSLLISR